MWDADLTMQECTADDADEVSNDIWIKVQRPEHTAC